MKRTIAYITDIHLDEAFVLENGVDPKRNWRKILNDVQNRQIDTILFGGDIGEPDANHWFFESLTDFDLDITLGNHDNFTEASKHLKKESWVGKTEAYYCKEDAYFKYLYLDSSSSSISEPQREWLSKELQTVKTVLLFIHHPILAIDTAVDRAYPLQNREHLQQLLQQRKANTIIFCGHYHMSDERSEGPVQQFITPAASFQIVKEAKELMINTSTFGYRLIHFDGNNISTEVIEWKSYSESSTS